MNLLEKITQANNEITIVGVLPIEEFLITNNRIVAEKLVKIENFRLVILHESESDLFIRSLYFDTKHSSKRISFKELVNKISRIKRIGKTFMFVNEPETQKMMEDPQKGKIRILQLNLKHSIYIIKIDGDIYTAPVLLEIPKLEDYKLETDANILNSIFNYLEFVTDKKKGGIYQSDPDDEMIEMYDREDIPRGIFPRKAFYNTEFQRYSVWVFVFNRKGQLMLHQRSKTAKDNAGLWDKSAGGHVDIKDRSSADSAERELIEEMYLSNAEYTKYLKGDTKDLINLGEWVPLKREEEQVLNLLKRMDYDDWGYFFLKPPIKRTSKRRFTSDRNQPIFRETKFISDIFFFVSPEDEIKDEESLKRIISSAAKERKLIEISELLDWIDEEKERGTADNTFTDDLLYTADNYKNELIGFSDYIKQIFKS